MQQMEWQLVPKEPTAEMCQAGWDAGKSGAWSYAACFRAMLDKAPEPPHLSMTKDEAAVFQDWRGMDGAIAFHLIERHANGWGDVGRMMEAWLAANAAPSNASLSGGRRPSA